MYACRTNTLHVYCVDGLYRNILKQTAYGIIQPLYKTEAGEYG